MSHLILPIIPAKVEPEIHDPMSARVAAADDDDPFYADLCWFPSTANTTRRWCLFSCLSIRTRTGRRHSPQMYANICVRKCTYGHGHFTRTHTHTHGFRLHAARNQLKANGTSVRAQIAVCATARNQIVFARRCRRTRVHLDNYILFIYVSVDTCSLLAQVSDGRRIYDDYSHITQLRIRLRVGGFV